MKKKLISLLCVASLLIGLLAGCGSSGSAQTAAEKPAAEKPATPAPEVKKPEEKQGAKKKPEVLNVGTKDGKDLPFLVEPEAK